MRALKWGGIAVLAIILGVAVAVAAIRIYGNAEKKAAAAAKAAAPETAVSTPAARGEPTAGQGSESVTGDGAAAAESSEPETFSSEPEGFSPEPAVSPEPETAAIPGSSGSPPARTPSALDGYFDMAPQGIDSAALPDDTLQLVVVKSEAGKIDVRLLEKDGGGDWTESELAAARAGAGGIDIKEREGDKITPAGLFGISDAFYISDKPETGLNTFKISGDTYWVDDPKSEFYNTRVEGTENKDWSSAEHMSAYASSYKYGFVIDYNTERAPGLGSAIFFHVGGGETNGCVAVSEEVCLRYLKALDEKKNPRILLVSDSYSK
jgi:L,D-peptidoglycan transpeptidase YkuD (ErfK/YbiS/YcfS/YnhG family)